MGSKFSPELRDQVIKECSEVGLIVTVCKKHYLNVKTVSNWVRSFNNRDSINEMKQLKTMAKKIQDQDLEIRVLKSLLKKLTKSGTTKMAMGGWEDMKTMQIYFRKAGVDIKGIAQHFGLT